MSADSCDSMSYSESDASVLSRHSTIAKLRNHYSRNRDDELISPIQSYCTAETVSTRDASYFEDALHVVSMGDSTNGTYDHITSTRSDVEVEAVKETKVNPNQRRDDEEEGDEEEGIEIVTRYGEEEGMLRCVEIPIETKLTGKDVLLDLAALRANDIMEYSLEASRNIAIRRSSYLRQFLPCFTPQDCSDKDCYETHKEVDKLEEEEVDKFEEDSTIFSISNRTSTISSESVDNSNPSIQKIIQEPLAPKRLEVTVRSTGNAVRIKNFVKSKYSKQEVPSIDPKLKHGFDSESKTKRKTHIRVQVPRFHVKSPRNGCVFQRIKPRPILMSTEKAEARANLESTPKRHEMGYTSYTTYGSDSGRATNLTSCQRDRRKTHVSTPESQSRAKRYYARLKRLRG